jgi:hypothetical protein
MLQIKPRRITMNMTRLTAAELSAKYNVTKAVASAFVRFLVDSGIGTKIATVHVGRGKPATTVEVPTALVEALGTPNGTRTSTMTLDGQTTEQALTAHLLGPFGHTV